MSIVKSNATKASRTTVTKSKSNMRSFLRSNALVSAETLDSSMDSMEETRLRKKFQKLTLRLAGKLHLNYNEIECLLVIYYKLQKDSKDFKYGIDKTQFRIVLHCALDMVEDYIMDRIFFALDKGPTPFMSIETWTTSLSLFLRGTLEEKTNYCYSVYDTLSEGVLGKETMFHLLKSSLLSLSGEEDAEESAKEMIEVLIKKMDLDRDGKISLNDFKLAVQKQPMLLETFGQCLPSRHYTHTFLTTFSHNVGKM